jgi:hypothetical protein
MLGDNKNDTCDGEDYIRPASKTERDLEVQLVLSLILGIGAFVAFCVSLGGSLVGCWTRKRLIRRSFVTMFRFCVRDGRLSMLRARGALIRRLACRR